MSQNQLSMFEQKAEARMSLDEVVLRRVLGINRITYRNFKRLTEYALEPNGESLDIYGANGTGKTTLEDGPMWLLFDKDSLNQADFGIKYVDGNNEPAHHLEHEVEGVFTLDGKILTLRKVFKEKWTKKRGAPVESFEGHETQYYIDDVPISQSKYKEKVASIIEEKAFRLLSDPRYFNEVLHWSERRSLLLEVCGGISDAEVIASDKRLARLSDILGDRSLEDHKKVIKAQHAKINKELGEIPARIDEVSRMLPDTSGTEPELLAEDIRKARDTRQEKADELSRVEQGGGVAEKSSELRAVQSKMQDMESAARRTAQDAQSEKRRALSEAQTAYSQAERQHHSLIQTAEGKEQEAGSLGGKLDELCAKWEAIDSEKLTYSAETVCPTCGQDLPNCQIEEARQKALEAFNESKSKRLEQNEAEGQSAAKRKKALESEAVKYRNEAALHQKKMQEQKTLQDRLQAELAKIPTTVTVTDPEYNRLAMERDSLAREIENMKASDSANTQPIRQEIAKWDSVIAGFEQQLARWQQRQQGDKRIEELKERAKYLAAEYERLSEELFLTEEFDRIQASMLETRVASKFSFVRFKLFNPQINGGLERCCETLVDGVPYSKGLNGAAKIQAGLDIINTLQSHYGFIAPIWLDNRESVTWIPETKAQVISLIVSPEDKVLRIEYPKEVQ